MNCANEGMPLIGCFDGVALSFKNIANLLSQIGMERLKKYPGQRKNSWKYYWRGRYFYRDTRKEIVTPRYRCADRDYGCKMVLLGEKNNPLYVTPENNHIDQCTDPDYLIPEKEDFRALVTEIAKNCSKPLKKIFDDEMDRKLP